MHLKNRSILDRALIRQATHPLPVAPSGRAWSDDYSNIAQTISLKKALSR